MTDERFAHEKRLTILARHGQSVRRRWAFGALAVALALGDAWFGYFPVPWYVFALPALVVVAANAWCAARIRADRVHAAHFWSMLALDVLAVAAMCAMGGDRGPIAMGFYIVVAAAYGLGLPRAAKLHVALSAVEYPLARAIGGAPVSHIALETACLVALSWLAIASPMRFTYRLRRARRALGALERGDFTSRLPTRALDDLGFLAVSFNSTAEALGASVDALRASEARLVAAEREARTTAARMHAVADAAASVLAADSEAALRDIVARACEEVLDVDEFTLAIHDGNAEAARFLGPRPTDRDSAIHMPIVAGAIVYGTLVVRSRSAVYDAADVEVLGAIAALAATAVRNIRLVDELRRSRRALAHQAFHDPLTGLANRTRFHDLLALALGGVHADHVAVVMIDLDGFKLVNDQLGHAAGDRLLAGVADRLLNATRGADTVSRLGGDEFAVLLENVHHIADAEVVAQRILKALRAPFDIEGVAVTVGASIGIARHSPLDNGNGDALLRRADLAMYDVKASGKGGYIVYNSPRERRLVAPKLTLSV